MNPTEGSASEAEDNNTISSPEEATGMACAIRRGGTTTHGFDVNEDKNTLKGNGVSVSIF